MTMWRFTLDRFMYAGGRHGTQAKGWSPLRRADGGAQAAPRVWPPRRRAACPPGGRGGGRIGADAGMTMQGDTTCSK